MSTRSLEEILQATEEEIAELKKAAELRKKKLKGGLDSKYLECLLQDAESAKKRILWLMERRDKSDRP